MSKGHALIAEVVSLDEASDVALLKVATNSVPLPIAESKSVRLGDLVATVGFPSISLLGSSPKYSSGNVAGLLGVQDDPTAFQVSLPKPGNSAER